MKGIIFLGVLNLLIVCGFIIISNELGDYIDETKGND